MTGHLSIGFVAGLIMGGSVGLSSRGYGEGGLIVCLVSVSLIFMAVKFRKELT